MFLTACWICGFEYTFNTGEVFGAAGDWMRDKLPESINKPLFDCPYCMASFHGTLFFMRFLSDNYAVDMYIVFCFSLCGLIAILRK